MSVMRCEGCGRQVDTDLEDCETVPVATGQEDWAFFCPQCYDRYCEAEENLYLENMRQQTESK